MTDWGFYGRRDELDRLAAIFGRGRWFFLKVTGRRRIGKTTLIQRALPQGRPVFYVQVPDSAAAGVLSAVHDALETFQVPADRFPAPRTLRDLAALVGTLARAGYVVAIDEFQYFNRKHISEFSSALQAEVDRLAADAASVPGGLVVLGSMHAEIAALLEDRSAPLYNRTTDELHVGHLDIESVLEILRTHGEPGAERLLFLWSLFEGVPKFYRDCFEQGVLATPRRDLLRRIFFESSSPLRTEADNWFLKELRGRYDVVLKFIARHPGCANSDIRAHVAETSPESDEQVGGYLKVLTDRYAMIERRLPVFAERTERRGRYYIRDNFLRSWLAALANPAAAVNFRPVDQLVEEADRRLEQVEGHSLERLVGQVHEELSRKGRGEFPLTHRVQGYWDRGDTEIDLVALNEDARVIRFGSCRRSETKLPEGAARLDDHVERFLDAHRRYRAWRIEKVGIAPTVSESVRGELAARGHVAHSLGDLLRPLV